MIAGVLRPCLFILVPILSNLLLIDTYTRPSLKIFRYIPDNNILLKNIT